MTTSDVERDEFMRTLVEVAVETGSDPGAMRQHPLFRAMLEIHGEDQVRGWLLLDALRTKTGRRCNSGEVE